MLRACQRTTVDAQAAVVVDHRGPRPLAFGADVSVDQRHSTAAAGQYAMRLPSFSEDDTVLQVDAAALARHRANRTGTRGMDLGSACVDGRMGAEGSEVGIQPMAALARCGHLHTVQIRRTGSHIYADSAITLADDGTACHCQR